VVSEQGHIWGKKRRSFTLTRQLSEKEASRRWTGNESPVTLLHGDPSRDWELWCAWWASRATSGGSRGALASSRDNFPRKKRDRPGQQTAPKCTLLDGDPNRVWGSWYVSWASRVISGGSRDALSSSRENFSRKKRVNAGKDMSRKCTLLDGDPNRVWGFWCVSWASRVISGGRWGALSSSRENFSLKLRVNDRQK